MPRAEFEVALPGLEATVVCHELPAWQFLEDVPTDDRGDRLAQEVWIDQLLARAVVEPRLTIAHVHRLGADRDCLARTYLSALGWLDDAPAEVTPRPASDTATTALLMRPPGGDVKRLVDVMAQRWRILPSDILGRPMSEFVVNLKMLRDQRAGPPEDSEEELLTMIGRR